MHAVSYCFKIENCTDCSAYFYTKLPPILTGDNRGIKFAPFNVLYSKITEILAGTDLRLEPDFVDVWAHPVCCTLGLHGVTEETQRRAQSNYHFVQPASFRPIVVPEIVPYRPPSSPSLLLPQVYSDALRSRREELTGFHRQLMEVDESKRARVQQIVQGHFREWLQNSGKARQLQDLARLCQTRRQDPPVPAVS